MSTAAENPGRPVRERLATVPEPERLSILLELVRGELAAVTGQRLPRGSADGSPWRRLGIYRELATDLRQRLVAATGLPIPPTMCFDHPTPAALAGWLDAEFSGVRVEAKVPVPEGGGADDDPIAIVGMACRFPGGVRSPDELWQLAVENRDATSTFPDGRGWDVETLYHPEPGRPGSTYSRGGGFLHDADQFDPGFFGISPREATALDPQQRLLLETSWEALERSGINPLQLAGTRTGVYAGIAYQDYGPNWHCPPEGYAGHLLMGSLTSAASGRIAYTWGLEGPAITVDTACSSSLVALHLAAQALRTGECSLALAGGATVMATPGVFLEFSRKQGLAPDGRCKSFSADADGTGWGEGAGILVLERLSDACRNGHPVHALIRGSALNQDGASNGLTAPNGLAQQRVIRQALANAGLSPADVDAVEAHGTGTTLGDPIEAQALIATYGQTRHDDEPLWLGSLKSNIGHAQAAAVVGSVIKMVLAMRHGILPATLHVTEPSPHVDWSAGAVSLLTEQRPWPSTGRPRRAGISAFGVSGTNGHLILEEAPSDTDTDTDGTVDAVAGPADGTVVAWVVSGRTGAALRDQAGRLRAHVQTHPELRPRDIGHALAGRARFTHRAVAVATGRDGFLRALDALTEDGAGPELVRDAAPTAGKVAFLFSGQGSQRPGMGRELYGAYPVFARAWEEVCQRLDPHLERPLQDVVWAAEGSTDADLLDQTAYTQPALFALEVSLFRLVNHWGLTPDLLLGHSIGELAAAHVAGVLSLDDACVLVAARARLMQGCWTGGAMASIQAGEDEVRAALHDQGLPDRGLRGRAEIALVNGPLATVVAGDADAVEEVTAGWEAAGRRATRLRVSHAFHSAHLDSMLDEFRDVAESLSFAPPTIPIVSNLTGEIATAAELGAPEYWVRQVREPVRFLDGMRRLETEEVTAFLEIGPAATLTALGRSCLTERLGAEAVLVPAMRAGRPESRSLTTALAELSVRGVPVDWQVCFEGRGARRVELPTYAFQRQRYWLDAPGLVPGREPPPADATGWRYRVAWKPTDVPAARLTGTWLVVAGASTADYDLVGVLTAVLVGHGVQVIPITLTDTELDRDQIATRLGEALADGGIIDGVLSLLALDDTPRSVGMTRGVGRTVALAQAWAAEGVNAPLWCVTQRAVSVGDGDPLRNPGQAMVWGLGRSVGLEQPRRWGGLIDLPDVLDEPALERVCGALAGPAGEDQLAVRGSGVFVRRVLRAGNATPETWRPRGTVLITGGTGALGGHAARWLARNGAEHIVVLSRRGPQAPGAGELRDELTALGVAVTVAACDVADRESLARLLASLPAEPPLTAVVHAAGTSGSFTALTEVSPGELDDVVTAKVAGAVHLDALLAEHPLDAFVLTSSIAGVWGSGGQAAYSAGNAFLDALALSRRARGLAATSVAWGPWARDGMAADPAIRTHLAERGLPAMAPEAATAALWHAVAAGDTTVAVADVDWQRFLPTFTAARASHLFDDLPEAGSASPENDSQPTHATWARRLGGTTGPVRDRLLVELVRAEAADILGHATAADLDIDCPFLDLGFDSLAAVELRSRLARATGLALAPTVVFDHPTATALARYLGTALADDTVPPPVRSRDARTPAAPSAGTGAEQGTVRFLYRRACELDMFDAGLDVLKAAAKLRPVFRTAAEFGPGLELTRLAEGSAGPALVCFPPFVAPCGPHIYARLALSLNGRRDVYSMSHPGFGTGEPLPATVELVVAMLAQAVLRRLGDTPFALAGYSSGGWFAHAVTAHLESVGVFPTTVVLLDSLAVRADAWRKIRPPMTSIALNDQAFALMTDDQLTATAAYFRLFARWKPAVVATPVLLARATGYLPGWQGGPIEDEYWQASWNHTHEVLELPGDHSSIMKENVTSTALALHRWLGGR